MGIQGLTKLLGDNAPGCMRESKFENYFGRKIAVDASTYIYSFLVVVGRVGDQLLTSEAGEVTSHLQGMFFRTARMLEAGMRPVFVFEGKPPELKMEELAKRSVRREGATADLAAAKEAGNAEDIEKYSKRTVRVTREHNEECRRLLQLMGVPVLEAPGEAEAQCAELVRGGVVYGMSTEDMDALTFATPRLIRHLMAPASQKQPPVEFDYDKMLAELGMTGDQFIDLCILLGCDYAGKIAGIGPVRALTLLKKHETLEKVLESLDGGKNQIPDPYPYQEARRLFKDPTTIKTADLPAFKWSPPDTDGLVQFLVNEKSFAEDRVRKAIDRIVHARGKANQGRLESFFGPTTTTQSTMKRKDAPTDSKAAAKKGKLGGMGGAKTGFGTGKKKK